MKKNLKFIKASLVLAVTLISLLGFINNAIAWTLSGTVYGGSNPLPNSTITLINASTSSQVGTSVTNTNGVYNFTATDGNYNLTITPPSGSEFSESVVNGILVNGSDLIQNAILVSTLKLLSGTIKDEKGNPLSGVEVSVFTQPALGIATSNSSGYYSLSLGAGTYDIRYKRSYSSGSCSIFKHITVNTTITNNENFSSCERTISGKTVDDFGVPVGNVLMLFTVTSTYNDGNSLYWSPTGKSITSGSDGTYSLITMPGGFSVKLTPPSNMHIQKTYSISIPSADVTRDFIAPNNIYALSGTIKDENGNPLSGVEVSVFTQPALGIATSNSSGYYSLSLGAGTYDIRYKRSYSSGSCSIFKPIVIESDTLNDEAFESGYKTINGRITDNNGVSVSDVKVLFTGDKYYNYNVGIYYYSTSDSELIKSGVDGEYTVNLIYGRYLTELTPPLNSGFSIATNTVLLSNNILQNYILAYPDNTSPIILSGPTVHAVTDTIATIEWQTNEPAKGSVLYGSTNPPAILLDESTFWTTHSQTISGLTENTTYYIKVTATDKSSNGPTSSSFISFTTKPTPDISAPVFLEGPIITNITSVGAVVEWKTNEPTTGSVQYGTVQTLGQTVTDSTLATNHRIELTGLTADTLYYLKISATDVANNGPTLSPLSDFRTKLTPDTKAQVIVEGPMVVDISDTGATVIWRTDEPATSGVSWNNSTAYDLVTDDTRLTINHSIRLTGLTASTLYNYTVSSKDAARNGPTLSVTKTFTTLPTPDIKAPVITEGPLVVNVTHQSAFIRWRTDEPTNGVIQYDTTPAFGSTESHSTLTQPHNMTLTGLAAGTEYYFRVGSKDSAGNGPTYSATSTFTTDDSDYDKKPAITQAPEIIYKDNGKAVIYWETDDPCDSVVEYDGGDGETHRASDGEKTQKHQVTITNLNSITSYNVIIASTDNKGNTVYAKAGRPATFLALGELTNDAGAGFTGTVGFMSESLPDTIAPFITATPEVVGISSDRVIVKWETDEISNSQIFFGTIEGSLLQTAGEITPKKYHLIVLTNLQAGTTYYYTVQSTDPGGNGPTISSILNFTTADTPDQVTPQITSGPALSGATTTSITVSWITNEHSTTQVRYGTASSNLTQMNSIPELATDHQVTLNGLVTGTTYFLQAVSSDSSANQVISSTIPFTTAGSYMLIVTIDGNGSGSIGGTIPMCLSGTPCEPNAFSENAVVRLTPYPDLNSVFDSWNASCVVTGIYCDVTMDGSKTATATFKEAHKVKIGNIPYSDLKSAFEAADMGQIKAMAIEFNETVTLTLPTNFKGGYNANFDPDSTVDNYTIINGSLTIGKDASLTVKGLKLRSVIPPE